MKTVFKITITNWEKHNPNKKKNHRYFLLENRFFEDAKTSQLKPIESLLFIKLLCVAGELLSNHFEVHAGLMPSRWRMSDQLLTNCCNSLQQLQLISYEKKNSLLIQEKRKEGKTGKEDKLPRDFDLSKNSEIQEPENLKFFPEKISIKKHLDSDFSLKESCKLVWISYKDSYIKRYEIDPKRNVKVNSQIKQLVQRLGVEDAIRVVEFYLTHNDSLYLKTSHNIGLCLQNAENLFSEMKRGVQITQSKINSYNKQSQYQDLIDDINKNGI